jgi:hypothetical protein
VVAGVLHRPKDLLAIVQCVLTTTRHVQRGVRYEALGLGIIGVLDGRIHLQADRRSRFVVAHNDWPVDYRSQDRSPGRLLEYVRHREAVDRILME